MPLVVMVVGPIVEAVLSSAFLVAAVMLPLTCMAAADSMVTSARCRQRLAARGGSRSTCCFDTAGYDASDDEEGVADGEHAAPQEPAAAPQKALSLSAAGLVKRCTERGEAEPSSEEHPPCDPPPERALSC